MNVTGPDGGEMELGYIGRIIPPESHDDHYFGDVNVPEGAHVLTVGASRVPVLLDRVLRMVTFGVVGYSLEPSDVTTISVDPEVAGLFEPGQKVWYNPEMGYIHLGTPEQPCRTGADTVGVDGG